MGQFPPEQLLKITLQAQEWNVVMAALLELPAKTSFAVIVRLQQQFEAHTPHQQQQAGNNVQTEQTA